MSYRLISLAMTAVAALGLAACDRTNWEPSLYRTMAPNDASVVTDAKQRVIINRQWDDGRVVCAEPSPDVTQTFSEVVKIAADLSKPTAGAGGQGQNTGASFTNSFAASVAQLGERLAVIQLFRDRMYRICEAFANKAIDKVTYTLMLARNDKTMATLLTTEMAAGAFGRMLVRLGGTAGSSGVDPEKRAQLQSQIVNRTTELEEIAKGNKDQAVREKEATKIVQELEDAHEKLLALDLAAARTSALSGLGGSAPGAIKDRIATTDADVLSSQIAGIHRNYIDDPGLEPLTDACLASLSKASLNEKQAKRFATAKANRAKAIKSIEKFGETKFGETKFGETIKLDANTIDFLEKLDADNLEDEDKTTAKDLGADTNEDDKITKEELDNLIRQSKTSMNDAQKAQTELYTANIEMSAVTLSVGDLFADFCLTNVFGEQTNSGYVKAMINARKELRILDKPTDNEVRLKQLEACQALVPKLDKLKDTAQWEPVLTMCEQAISGRSASVP